MPKNTRLARGTPGTIDLEPALAPGLEALDGFSHLLLLFHFHRSEGWEPEVVPPGDAKPRGVFATRSPRRPNGIGVSVVRLQSVEGATLHVLDVDVVDGTPLLDIKPYLPTVDSVPDAETGGLEPPGDGARTASASADPQEPPG